MVLGFLALAIPLAAAAFDAPCRGLTVHDGDTVKCAVVELGFNTALVDAPVRINGINAPELSTAAGKAATAAAQQKLAGLAVTLRSPHRGDRDKFGRLLADLILPDGSSFAAWMIAQHLAAPWGGEGPKPLPSARWGGR